MTNIKGTTTYLLIGVVFIGLSAKAMAQADTLWSKTYDVGYAYDVHVTRDAGFIIACDRCIIKTDSLGNALWVSTFGGEPFHRYYSIFELDDG
ncbi:MAG: hypothetical protein GF315_04515, partial [candidate division Zixibacteria bacterium]|nr:hypothetical protein [candidate division Zixibacteria bacterium]